MQHAATFRPPPSPRRSAASTPISPRRSRESDGSPRMLGTIVAGKYVVSRLIGTGGMGTVWEAIHLRLRTRVAIKFMQADRAANAGLRKRFEIEAKAAGRLSTRHAVKIFDYGVTDCGRPYIVMEYLSGGSLAQAIAERGPLSAREVALIVRQAARALAEAHAAGIVHRDIKPDNVFLAEEGDDTQSELPYTTKIVDFGIASVMRTDLKARGPNGESVRKVGPATDGTLVGTPHFMSPEQLTLGGPPTPQDDVWALAACTFMALTGKAPFDGATLGDVVLAVCTRPLPVPSKVWPGVPKGFDELFERTCSREPEKRFQTALELADALGALCGLPPRAAPQLSLRRTTIRLEAEAPPESWPTLRAPSVKPPEPPPERPRRKSAALIALTMIVVLLFGAWLGWARPGPGARAELTEGDPG
jgi:serine/threonine-protein kinase